MDVARLANDQQNMRCRENHRGLLRLDIVASVVSRRLRRFRVDNVNPVYSPANAAQPLDFLILSVKSSICKGCHGR